MFKDPRARRAWRLYFLKAEAVLTPLSASVRRELIDDLKAHVADILANEQLAGDEPVRLAAALQRVGDPKEFLAPLLAEAVFRAPPQHGSLAMTYRTLSLYAGRGAAYMVRAVGLVLAAAAGVSVAIAALNSLIRPDRAGLFFVEPDTYQLRILGLSPGAGEQLLAPWMAVLLIGLGIALIAWTGRRVRKMLIETIASAV
jgi:hypothetical protein